jgi:hypothetical protein
MPQLVAGDRHRIEIDFRRVGLVDGDFRPTGLFAARKRGKIHKRKTNRAFDLVGALTGQKHRRAMGVDAFHTSGTASSLGRLWLAGSAMNRITALWSPTTCVSVAEVGTSGRKTAGPLLRVSVAVMPGSLGGVTANPVEAPVGKRSPIRHQRGRTIAISKAARQSQQHGQGLRRPRLA